VETTSERARLGGAGVVEEVWVDGASAYLGPVAAGPSARLRRSIEAVRSYRTAIFAYLGTRALLLGAALVNGLEHHSVLNQFTHWDGVWYAQLAAHGYPHVVAHTPTTLGFFALYPIVLWALGHVFVWGTADSLLRGIQYAGVFTSLAGGLVATLLVQKLGTRWWDQASGRRAAVLFAAFPGSVVFSMVYAEGILIPLAIGTILALERRRWLCAGVLAGLATATEPEALILVLVCALAAARELRRSGWRAPAARRSVLAPLLSLTGVAALLSFLWAWTGSPFATLIAQRDGWHEHSDPLALVHLVQKLAAQVSFTHFNHPTINLNLVSGVLGALALFAMLALIWRSRNEMSLEAIVWTLGISLVALTATYPFSANPRVLITAFPAVMVVGRYVSGRRFAFLAAVSCAALAGMGLLTFVRKTLRP
jgi:Gpi18-like mannosyltransferase